VIVRMTTFRPVARLEGTLELGSIV
jgi:hypothetical protein